MADWKDWSEGWLKERQYLSFMREGVIYYERVFMRDIGHWEYDWPETVPKIDFNGPHVPDQLEITRGYDKITKLNRIWQMIFGIKGQALIYIELPTDLKRHGIPKVSWPKKDMPRVAHFEEYMSPFNEPTFLTEHFMMRPDTPRIDFYAYNPNDIDLTDLTLNIILNKMVTERIGTETYTEKGLELKPTRTQFTELLKKLYQRLVPCRPITLLPVRAPAEAPSGE